MNGAYYFAGKIGSYWVAYCYHGSRDDFEYYLKASGLFRYREVSVKCLKRLLSIDDWNSLSHKRVCGFLPKDTQMTANNYATNSQFIKHVINLGFGYPKLQLEILRHRIDWHIDQFKLAKTTEEKLTFRRDIEELNNLFAHMYAGKPALQFLAY